MALPDWPELDPEDRRRLVAWFADDTAGQAFAVRRPDGASGAEAAPG